MAPREKSGPGEPRPPRSGPSEVAPGVFVGGWDDAASFEGPRICVLEEAPSELPAATHIPIYDEETGRADVTNLDRVAEAIGKERAGGRSVLVFCGHGVRRSPLAAAWYLHRAQQLSLDDAYARIRAVRPRVEDARSWLENADEIEAA